MLVCARLRHVAGTQWGNKKYMNMKHLVTADSSSAVIDGSFTATVQFEKPEIHTAYLRFPNFHLYQNFSPSTPAD